MMLEHLQRCGFTVSVIVLQRNRTPQRIRHLVRVVGLRHAVGLAWRKAVDVLRGGRRQSWQTDAFYTAHTDRLVVVPHLNHAACREILVELQPDIAIVGCAGILRPEVFQVPRYGTLNVHPGLLPQYRGLSPVCWALLDGNDVGVTLHFIDTGIDTGPIVAQQHVEVRPGDTITDVRRKVWAAGFGLLTEALTKVASGQSLSLVRQPRETSGYRRMAPVAAQRRVEKKLAKLAADARRGGERGG